MSCFYLIASLPALAVMQKPTIASEDLLSLCEAQLGTSAATAVAWLSQENVLSPPPPAHPFVTDWVARETQLRNAVARMRATRQKRDAAGSIRPHSGFDVRIEHAVEAAFDAPTPLEREASLDRLRWSILDELAGVDPFSERVVLAYAVKLRMAQRWAALDPSTGMKRLDQAISATAGNDDEPANPIQQPPGSGS